MKDFLGQELKEGDRVVACMSPYRSRYDFYRATVQSLTPKMVRIITDHKDGWGWGSDKSVLSTPKKLIKMEGI